MLILTRRIGEIICINEDIEVVVLGINGMQVKLGIEAPKEIPVHRKEVYLRIKEENEFFKPPTLDPSPRFAGGGERG